MGYMIEEWKPIPEYPKYLVSNFGRVISTNNKKRKDNLELSPTLNKNRGYYYVAVQETGKKNRKNYILHRLVARLFLPRVKGKEYINHIDGNKRNNIATNLEWCTAKENNQHAIINGLAKKMGKNEGNIKYTNEQCSQVVERVKQGMTYIKAGEICKMPYSTVAHLIRGSRRKLKEITL